MTAVVKTEAKARTFGRNIESDLASRFLRVVETAAIASARTMGQGERKLSDQVATEAMRKTMDSIPMRGTIVIGEGERDEAPMLYIGEKVGAEFPDGTEVPEVDIAVDPLEGTNLCATGAPGAITVLAASESGGLLQRAGLLYGKDRGRARPQGRGGHRCAGDRQPQEHCQTHASRRRGLGGHRARSAAAREADCRIFVRRARASG